MTATEEAAPARKADKGGLGAWLRELLIVVVGALVVSILIRAFVGQMFIIPSQSMENTLLVGDRVVVQKITDVKRGQVVVFADPGGWLSDEEAGNPTTMDRVLEFIGIPTANGTGHLIKRLIGLPGDRVQCCDTQGRLTVNGKALDESSYLYRDPDGVQVAPSEVRFEVVVPKDRIFVMGDHRDLSADSRCHLSDISRTGPKGDNAFVPMSDVVGPAFAVAWPIGRAAWLKQPETFKEVPAPGPAPDRAEIHPQDVSC